MREGVLSALQVHAARVLPGESAASLDWLSENVIAIGSTTKVLCCCCCLFAAHLEL